MFSSHVRLGVTEGDMGEYGMVERVWRSYVRDIVRGMYSMRQAYTVLFSSNISDVKCFWVESWKKELSG